jgi:potassium efflux system protein
MNRKVFRRNGWLGLALWAGCAGGMVSAQGGEVKPGPSTALAQTTQPVVAVTEELTLEAIQARMQRIESTATLDDAAKKTLLDSYRQAQEQLRLADAQTQRAAQFDQARLAAPQALEAVRAETTALPTDAKPVVPADATLDQLKAALSEAQVALAAALKQSADLAAEAKRRADRRIETPNLTLAARERLDRLNKDLEALPLAGEAPEATLARRTLLLASKKALDAELDATRREILSYDARAELSTARRELAARHLALAERTVKVWQDLVDERQRVEAERAARAAREALAAARLREPVRPLAEENDRLAQQRTGPQGLLANINTTLRDLEAVNKSIDAVNAQFESLRERVRVAGVTEAISLLLRKHRAELPSVRQLQRAIRVRHAKLADVQLEFLAIEEQYHGLTDLEGRLAAFMAALPPAIGAAERAHIETAARELLQTQRALLEELRRDYDRYLGALIELDARQQALAADVQRYATFIDEQVFWFRSAPALSPRDVAHAWDAAQYLTAPANWDEALDAAWLDLGGAPAPWGLTFLAVGVLLAVRRRLRRALRRLADLTPRTRTDAFGHTLRALAYTVMLAAPGPLAVGLVGWRLAAAGGAPEFAKALGAALLQAAAVFLSLAFLRVVCREGGLGEAHFRWPAQVLRLIRRHLAWYAPLAAAATFLVVALESQANAAYRHSLGRAALIVGLLATSAFLQRLFRRSGALAVDILARYRTGWLNRLRWLWHPPAVFTPAALAVAAAWGYAYTAWQLAVLFVQSGWLILGLVLVNALAVRWVFVTRRRLAWRDAQKRLAEAPADARAPAEAQAAPVEEPEVSLFLLGQQTHQVLRSIMAVALVLGLWLIWADILPALGFLARIRLWGAVSLADLLLATLAIIVTVVLGRNIPGLLEITLLRRLDLAPGVRYAVSTVGRYLITIVGVIVAFGAVGVGWTQVQWLAAAITVGLGFGLQEIFANFVSGLILLIERPIRVGDTVTVGAVSGTVTRIRMRATTVMDWDRKELIVPNKELVTGRIINWSLSDTVTRLCIPVGVAYGSNVEQVRDLLLSVARAQPEVLREPPPMAPFLGFGDNALNFELRVFLPGLSMRLKVQDAMHTAIERAFRQAGVTIAFPQRDIHLVGPLDVRVSRIGPQNQSENK